MPINPSDLPVAFDAGWATLIAAVITAVLAAVVSAISSVVSVKSNRSLARLVSDLNETTTIGKEAREYKLKQLTEFYDPVYTLLSANKSIFEKLGPTSEVRESRKFDEEETAGVWKKLSEEVIVPNNLRLCEIIQSQLHYLSSTDVEATYLEFLTHAHAYKVFKQGAYEAYSLFQFPKPIYEQVANHRLALKSSVMTFYLPTRRS